jgi:hypothetical protein
MIALLISLVVWGLIFYVLWWGLGKIGLPEPFNKIAVVVLVVATVYVLIELLLGGIPPFHILG